MVRSPLTTRVSACPPVPVPAPGPLRQLRRWADVLLIAPLSANTMAKLCAGLCDNLLTCVARAWEVGRKPVVVAPAMNTAMWEHPLVRSRGVARSAPPPSAGRGGRGRPWHVCRLRAVWPRHPGTKRQASGVAVSWGRGGSVLKASVAPPVQLGRDPSAATLPCLWFQCVHAAASVLGWSLACPPPPVQTRRQLRVLTEELGVVVVNPIAKLLVCGDVGVGAMATVDTVVQAVRDAIAPPADAPAPEGPPSCAYQGAPSSQTMVGCIHMHSKYALQRTQTHTH
jgi:hypothetical protein